MSNPKQAPTPDSLCALTERLRAFAAARDWDQFHSPKNLAMALAAETGELLEHFQWLTEEQSKALPALKLTEVAMELADIQIYIVRIADRLGVDLLKSANAKIDLNEQRYPADRAKGSAKKHNEL